MLSRLITVYLFLSCVCVRVLVCVCVCVGVCARLCVCVCVCFLRRLYIIYVVSYIQITFYLTKTRALGLSPNYISTKIRMACRLIHYNIATCTSNAQNYTFYTDIGPTVALPKLIYNDNNNNLRVSNIRVSNRTLIYNVCPKSALT